MLLCNMCLTNTEIARIDLSIKGGIDVGGDDVARGGNQDRDRLAVNLASGAPADDDQLDRMVVVVERGDVAIVHRGEGDVHDTGWAMARSVPSRLRPGGFLYIIMTRIAFLIDGFNLYHIHKAHSAPLVRSGALFPSAIPPYSRSTVGLPGAIWHGHKQPRRARAGRRGGSPRLHWASLRLGACASLRPAGEVLGPLGDGPRALARHRLFLYTFWAS